MDTCLFLTKLNVMHCDIRIVHKSLIKLLKASYNISKHLLSTYAFYYDETISLYFMLRPIQFTVEHGPLSFNNVYNIKCSHPLIIIT